MPPMDGLLKRTLPDLSRSRETEQSLTSNTYDTVNLSESSSAVLGNVVHQHFYQHQSSEHDSLDADEDGESRSVGLRKNLSKAQVEAISGYDHRTAHWLRAQRRLPETCNWITELAKFKDWVTGADPPILLCVGSVGCGKSINASAAIDWLSKLKVNVNPPVMSYYIDETRPRPATTSDILRALVKQVVIHYRESNMLMPRNLYDKVEAICTPLASANTSIFNLTGVMQHFLRLQPLCFVVIDGVDSLADSEIPVFMNFLRHVWNPQLSLDSQSKLMLSCRETLGRRIRLENIPSSTVLQIKLNHIKSDIHRYVDSEVPVDLSANPELMGSRIDDVRPRYPRSVESLPQGLDEVYLRCLHRIDTINDKRSREIAPRIFKWLASAQVALTPTQAREVVSMTPENLPLPRSQLLVSPVTDYCANLVVVDDLTGTVKFTHPSVKTFLYDSDKVPPKLRYLALSHPESDSWCGQICLAHARLHHSRKQLVAFRSQEIESNITKPILENIFRNVLPFKTRPRHPQYKSTPFRMPISTKTTSLMSSVADLSLHAYMCQHWLAHNTSIHKGLSHYANFVDLCVAHDPDLQPWSTSPVTNIDHYRRMVMHAVMINHAPLLGVAQDALRARGRTHWRGVFPRYAPGTDSTYLHCAAVLGHTAILHKLLVIYFQYSCEPCSGSLADARGTSAAFAAMQAQQIEAFVVLLIDRQKVNTSSLWQLRDLELEKPARQRLSATRTLTENLLDHCAAHGNLEAVRALFATMRSIPSYTFQLASPFFLACKNGHQDMGGLLIYAGAHHNTFAGPDDASLKDIRFISNDEIDALDFVLTYQDLKMMRNLLIIRRSVGITTSKDDLLQVVQYFSRGQQYHPDPYLHLLLEFGGRNEKPDRPGWELLSWLMCLPMLDERTSSSLIVDRFIRLVLRSSYPGPRSLSALRHHGQLPGSIEHDRLAKWLEWTTDDVSREAIRRRSIEFDFLMSPLCLRVVLSRYSSRLIESIFDSLSPTLWAGQGLLMDKISDMLFDGDGLDWMDEASVAPSQTQVLEFLTCMGVLDWSVWLDFELRSDVQRKYHATMSAAMNAYNCDSARPRYPCLMWVRCYLRMKGDVAATRQLCHDLRRYGGTGNFALNFPVGYDCVSGEDASTRTWVISQKIWLAIHRWNFRLNRAHKKPYSESDMRYMATVLSKMSDH